MHVCAYRCAHAYSRNCNPRLKICFLPMQIVCLDTEPVAQKPKKPKKPRSHARVSSEPTALFTSFMMDYMNNSNKGAADHAEMFAQFMAKQAKEMKGNLIVSKCFSVTSKAHHRFTVTRADTGRCRKSKRPKRRHWRRNW